MRGMDGGYESDDSENPNDGHPDNIGGVEKKVLSLNLDHFGESPLVHSLTQIFQGLIGSYEIRQIIRSMVAEVMRETESQKGFPVDASDAVTLEYIEREPLDLDEFKSKVDTKQLKQDVNNFSLFARNDLPTPDPQFDMPELDTFDNVTEGYDIFGNPIPLKRGKKKPKNRQTDDYGFN